MNHLPTDLLVLVLAPLLDTKSLGAFICAHRSHAPCKEAYRPMREIAFVVWRRHHIKKLNKTRNRRLKSLTESQRREIWQTIDRRIMAELASCTFGAKPLPLSYTEQHFRRLFGNLCQRLPLDVIANELTLWHRSVH